MFIFFAHTGYSEDDNTWEPRENLQCDELIDEFERQDKAKVESQSVVQTHALHVLPVVVC